jgi:spore coat polysaccharide biosynthesis protein SpsF (cytidylyltransferase family)
MKVIVIVQARMGSSRLPGKSLMDLGGRTVLARVLDRARRVPAASRVVVATTTAAEDAAIVEEAGRCGVDAYQGHPTDVLDRFGDVAAAESADVIVRITADCPLLDPFVSGAVVERMLRGDVDYVSNVDPPTFPDGLDTEAFSRAALDTASREARLPADREHVTPFIRRDATRFRRAAVTQSDDLSSLRWTLDEAADLAFLRAVYGAATRPDQLLRFQDVLALLAARPTIESPRRPRLNAASAAP